MSDKPKPSPDPVPSPDDDFDPVEHTLGGRGFRGEVAGCPTGLSRKLRPKPTEQSGTDKTDQPPPTGTEHPRGGPKP